ncbi:MAG TPA: superoxide dismutase family protein [Verrucomicrobiae bacterium]
MKVPKIAVSLLALPLAAFVTGCSTTDDHGHGAAAAHANAFANITQAVATMNPTDGNKAKGTVKFTQTGNKVKIVATIEGLNPNQKHAIHIHEAGDVSSKDGMATGGHYNPEGHPHAHPHAAQRHAGDLGNLQADAKGNATLELEVDNISIAGLKNPIVGRAVIIHAKEDDGGQPVGNAGARISQGAIGLVKPAAPAAK